MTFETEADLRKSSRETEAIRESRESREQEVDPELAAAAAMERADFIVKEVKQGKQQMQNIVLHMQQVKKAIAQLRVQLQLQASDDQESSVSRDEERVKELKEQIREYQDELVKMRGDLIREEMEELKNGVGVGMSTDELQARAEKSIDAMIQEVVES